MSGEPDHSSQAGTAIDADENDKPAKLQYADDIETGLRRGRSQRRGSTGSNSIRSNSLSRRLSIDPAHALPIHYRTL
jgi:hypothetical protein